MIALREETMQTLQNHCDFQSGGNFQTATQRGMSAERGGLSKLCRQRLTFRENEAAGTCGPEYLRGKSCTEKELQEPVWSLPQSG